MQNKTGMQTDRLIRGRVLYVSPERVVASRGASILESRDSGQSWFLLCKTPLALTDLFYVHVPLLRRLLRKGVHHLEIGSTYTMLIANKASYIVHKQNGIEYSGFIKGSRPLSLCQVGDDFYYGEYLANKQRLPVHIWKWSGTEKKWQAVWQFNNVRHVHGVFYDHYTDSIWVTTGDDDQEAGIWRTRDEFSTLDKIAGGCQQFRAVQLLFTKDYVYFGSDAPEERNFIYRMDRDVLKIEKLAVVSNPVYYGCKVLDKLFFSTAVEPSKLNKSPYAEIWGATEGAGWKMVKRFKKDIWPMKYFQYGQVLMPGGPGDGENLWLSPLAADYSQKSLRIPVRDLF
mgnify:CR=1 FL=1